MAKKKVKLNASCHALQRLEERYNNCISQKELIDLINNRKIYYAQKLTTSRSLVYGVSQKGDPFKAILRKGDKRVITFLPMKYDYCTEYKYYQFCNQEFRIKLFPDCFMSTHLWERMTLVDRRDTNGEWIECHSTLNRRVCFILAWGDYYHEKINPEKKS